MSVPRTCKLFSALSNAKGALPALRKVSRRLNRFRFPTCCVPAVCYGFTGAGETDTKPPIGREIAFHVRVASCRKSSDKIDWSRAMIHTRWFYVVGCASWWTNAILSADLSQPGRNWRSGCSVLKRIGDDVVPDAKSEVVPRDKCGDVMEHSRTKGQSRDGVCMGCVRAADFDGRRGA